MPKAAAQSDLQCYSLPFVYRACIDFSDARMSEVLSCQAAELKATLLFVRPALMVVVDRESAAARANKTRVMQQPLHAGTLRGRAQQDALAAISDDGFTLLCLLSLAYADFSLIRCEQCWVKGG